ncbi:MAG: ATP-binding cassette domain-containing protein [Bryobacteraceae bacterium]|nr:ATP-binding cassette domain-containing protein [Bryobacteraceae bacterium]
MIAVQNLVKTFHDKARGSRHVVDDVSFEVREREIFGLLGPNGAGKTTTLRLIATLLKPDSGTAVINGFDINREPEKVRSQLGFLSGDMGLYGRLSPREILTFYGRLFGMGEAEIGRRSEELIERFAMKEFAGVRTDKLSTGMKQKTAIARTMLHNPPVLILDEPTSGLDVPTARTIEESILEFRKAGKTVLFSTHVMEEAEYLCDRIAVIHEGKIKITGTMDELRAATGRHRLREIFLDLLGLPVLTEN